MVLVSAGGGAWGCAGDVLLTELSLHFMSATNKKSCWKLDSSFVGPSSLLDQRRNTSSHSAKQDG